MKMNQQPVKVVKTEFFGGSGGNPFKPSKTLAYTPNMTIAKINIRAGDSIDSIQFIMTDGMQYYELEKFGGTGGKAWEFVVPQGQFISEITVFHQPYCEGLQFKTNQGVTSQIFGKGRGSKAIIPVNGNLIGYGGRSGGLIDAIQFFYTC